MITNIAHFALLVRDYDEAIAFYCGKLGFLKIQDDQISSLKRFVRLAAPGQQGAHILLSKINPDVPSEVSALGSQAGGRVFFYLTSDDFDSDYTRFKQSGVTFAEEPRTESYGKVVIMNDLYGNRIDLIQPA